MLNFSTTLVIGGWKERLSSDFVLLVVRIACVVDGKEIQGVHLKWCIRITRSSKKKQSKKNDDGILTWFDCYKMIETIFSFKINKEIIFNQLEYL